MAILNRIRSAFRSLFRKAELDRNLDLEVDSYLEMLVSQNIDRGLGPDEARRQALIQLGGAEQVKEQVRDRRAGHAIESLIQDLKHGGRLLAASPGTTVIAIITMALAIGANTAIFSAIHTVLLTPMPFRDPSRLAMIWESKPAQGEIQAPLSEPNYLDISERSRSFSGLAAWTYRQFNLTGNNDPQNVLCAIASSNVFAVLGVEPVAGRGFLASEDKQGCAPVVMLSYRLWKERFASSDSVIGTNVTLDGATYQVIGVLPESLHISALSAEVGIWMPLGLDPFRDRKYARPVNSMGVAARLKPGVTLAQAQADLDTTAASLEKAYPDDNAGWKLQIESLSDQSVKHYKTILLVLAGAVGLVLLIACANIANLLLARSWSRQKELTIRAALGGTRRRLIAQLLTESLILGLAGGAVGLWVAFWGIRGLRLLPAGRNDLFNPVQARIDHSALDGRVLLFALAVSLATGLVFGILPAIQSTRPGLYEALKEGASRVVGGGKGQGTRRAMVVFQLAVSTALLIGAGLMIKNMWLLQQVSPGFEPASALTAEITLPDYKYPAPASRVRFYDSLLREVQALPGVRTASASEMLPLSGEDESESFFIEGRPAPPPGHENITHPRSISSGFFQAMGIPIRQGRGFVLSDSPSGKRVAIINDAMARRYFPNETPIGKRIAIVAECLKFRRDGPPTVDPEQGMREVVGVAGDVKLSALDEQPVPEVYIPYTQRPEASMSLVVRTAGNPLALAGSIREAVRGLDADQPVSHIDDLSSLVAGSIAQPRFGAFLLGLLAAMAFVLSAVGVYGVVSYSVAARVREIGIRMALGARRASVLGMIVRDGLVLSLAGALAGIVVATGLTRFLRSLLSGVSPTDVTAFTVLPVLMIAVAVAASYLPARRATRVDPIEVLWRRIVVSVGS